MIGEKVFWNGSKEAFMETIETTMTNLASEGEFPSWT
jgi:hypothetical protein